MKRKRGKKRRNHMTVERKQPGHRKSRAASGIIAARVRKGRDGAVAGAEGEGWLATP
jgi:hypothetical protein